MRIAINGFGRIGRQVFRMAMDMPEQVEVVHVNDVADVETLHHLLVYDSTHGVWDRPVRRNNSGLVVSGREVHVTAERDPSNLTWGGEGVDVVLESTGRFRTREEAETHRLAGAKKVLVSAPGKTPLDGMFVMGVNDHTYDPGVHHVISIGSCTTNCLAPMVKVLHEQFTVERGYMTTVHAYTASQNLQDGPHKDLRRARSAAENIIPTTTGAAGAIGAVIPDLDGKLDGMALRVPVSCGSITDLTCVVEKPTTAEEVNEQMHLWAEDRMQGILQVAWAPIVSRDVIGNTHSCVVSPEDTKVHDGTLVKVLGWYDNESGFSRRCLEMMLRMIQAPRR